MTEQRIGKYVIIEEIGRGAMGIVYKARDPLIDRIVAVKTIRFDQIAQPEQREEAQKRFLREAKSAGQLSHPRIVTIYEVGEDQGMAFIAMEFIEGRSLEAWLADKRRWSVEETVRFIIEVA
ncbi:MAG: protein kinase, partial [Acidobacteriota bacterium]|nr:protein kinase [Acidobacteriota bacterium]